MKTLRVRTPDQWRAWLAKNHAAVAEIWVVFFKQHTGVVPIVHKDALDEARLEEAIRLLDGGKGLGLK